MRTRQTPAPITVHTPDPAWHPFSWTADGHTPKIDVTRPAVKSPTADERASWRTS